MAENSIVRDLEEFQMERHETERGLYECVFVVLTALCNLLIYCQVKSVPSKYN